VSLLDFDANLGLGLTWFEEVRWTLLMNFL